MSYTFDKSHFRIENYDKLKTFSSFLPGIAGKNGIPLWVFYANRGQGVTSFGIKDKDEPILEFFPANTSYQYVDRYGFRSFVRVEGVLYEPFAVNTEDDVTRNMIISRGHFSIEEINHTRKINYRITYFGLTNEPFAGLVRKVEVINLGADRLVEVVDGIATILPSGATNESFKNMSNLMVSWMTVENLQNNVPFYKFRASSGDEAEVSMINKGHFYMSFVEDHNLVKPIVDKDMLFGYDTSLSKPVGIVSKALSQLDLEKQVVVNKVPCGFTPYAKVVGHGSHIRINTIIGHASALEIINNNASKYVTNAFIDQKLIDSEDVIDALVDSIDTETRYKQFDAYLKQSFLDNTLRGGFPLVFGEAENQKVYHIYSRKHGDPERDYNFFNLAPEFYSQGNGNFRDVNQNRRNDVYFTPEAGLFNVKMFMNLIQLDGYNPLSVKGTTFSLEPETATDLVEKHVCSGRDLVMEVLSSKFTPGKLSMQLHLNQIKLNIAEERFLEIVLSASEQNIEANFGEGFWVDHWTYNYDLIENYLSVFPDKLEHMLHEDFSYRFFKSPVFVLPRSQKYGLTKDGHVRQFGALYEDEHSKHFDETEWVRDNEGNVYRTNLAQKILSLVLNKFTNLDPFGIGIEMEANKPGWNDAMNGLPGVFGSGISETVELVRLVRFLKSSLSKDIKVLDEVYRLYRNVDDAIAANHALFDRWHAFKTAQEAFREETKTGVAGHETTIQKDDIIRVLSSVEEILMDGLKRAKNKKDGILPTYMAYRVCDYDILEHHTPYGLKAVNVRAFEEMEIPNFLEAPARSLKIWDAIENERLYKAVKGTSLYDQKLKTYKTSEPLDDMSYELGRIRAFTPGWLERESNFLHMTYKYLLGLLKGGLVEAFYEEIESNFVCFMNPEVYGRSTLENSSFIASSLNPDPKLHGQGFVSRLSGSTAELLSMWQLMMFGEALFTYEDKLIFTPKPRLHPTFFEGGRVRTTLFSTIDFVIENHTAKPTYSNEVEVAHYYVDGEYVTRIEGELAYKIRNREVKEVVMVYKNKEAS